MDVILDDENHHIYGNEVITYYNNSPDTLYEIYLHLYPNAFSHKKTIYAKEAYAAGDDRFYFASKNDFGNIDIHQITGENIQGYEINETIMRLALSNPLLPDSRTNIEISFDLKIPRIFSRLGHAGSHYEITQWYPKICVYDSAGWHNDEYHYLGEFFSDFGSYDISITLPSGYVVAATGNLMESSVPPEEAGTNIEKCLHYRATDIHDFAWVADRYYSIDTVKTGDITIEIYILPGHKKEWKDVGKWAQKALELYGSWYGEYAYDNLKIVDVGESRGGGMEYPGLVLISGRSTPLTNYHEAQVIHEIGHQWFYGVIATNELEEAWLDEGFTTFSEIRYFETVYGEDNNILDLPSWLPLKFQINKRTEAKYYYYLLASTRCEYPLNTPSYIYYRHPFGYSAYYYKAALVLFSLRDLMGEPAFNAAMRHYCHKFRFRHPTTNDFIGVCNQFADADLNWFFEQWINSDAVVDYSVTRMTYSEKRDSKRINVGYKCDVYLKRKTSGLMPLEVRLIDKKKNQYTSVWDDQIFSHKVLTFYTGAEPKSVTIDPDDKTLDYYRWNNHYPRKTRFQFLFDRPDMDAYQYFFIPYGWMVPPRLFLLGGIFQGRQFIDAGSILGRHQWSLFTAFDFNRETLRHAFSYQTPLGALGRYTRIYGGWYRDIETDWISLGLRFSFLKYPFSKSGSHVLDLSCAHTHLGPAYVSDPRDVSLGSFSSLKLAHDYEGGGIKFGGGWRARVKLGKDTRNDVFEFGKASVEIFNYFRFTSKMKIFMRFYAGYARGAIPAQEHFFLSGKLFPEKLLSLTWSNVGDLSSQERWHIWGDGNLRGYYGRHIKGKFIYSTSFEKDLPIPVIYVFFDAGYAANDPSKSTFKYTMSDFGLGVKIFKILRVDFPLWVSHPSQGKPYWDFRVIVGLARGFQ